MKEAQMRSLFSSSYLTTCDMNWILNTQDWGEETGAWMKSRMFLIYSVWTNRPLTMVDVPITRGPCIVHVFA